MPARLLTPARQIRTASAAALVLGIAALVIAWSQRFVLDDAFISFTYARSLAEGHGLTWFGERVEGYTNFLWVVWIAIGWIAWLDPIHFSIYSGLVAFAASMALLWRLTGRVFETDVPRLATLALFAGNSSVLAFATSGLETMAQTSAILAGLWLVTRLGSVDQPRIVELVGLGAVAALALLLRLDSSLPFGILVTAMLIVLPRVRAPRRLAAIVLPIVILVGSWLVWKASYYGSILPNTFHAKVDDSGAAATGVTYVASFLTWYWFAPVLPLGLAAAALRRRLDPIIAIAAAIVVAWCCYLALVGGDFMEFRMMVPVMPLVAILVVASMNAFARSLARRVQAAIMFLACAALVGASVLHATSFRTMKEDFTLDSVEYLRTFYGLYPDEDHSTIGRRLGSELEGTGATIAVHPAGAIPFYSRLRTVDMWGLNDLEIARAGTPAPASYRRPGHRRHATLEYLRRRGVTLVIGHPTLIRRGALSSGAFARDVDAWLANVVTFNTEPIERAVLAAMPLNERDALLMWYLTPDAAVERRMRERGWEAVRAR